MSGMNIKTDENGNAILEEGKPVYVWEDGKEDAIDVPGLFSKITSLNKESEKHRLKSKELSDKFKVFEEIEEPENFIQQAREAIKTVENFKDKQLMDAGEVEKIKEAVAEGYKSKLDDLGKALETTKAESQEVLKQKDTAIRNLLVKNAFTGSEFIRNKTNLLPDIAYEYFGKHFQIEENNGKPTAIALDREGNKLFSRSNPGVYAEPEEAIQLLISSHPNKDKILVSNAGGGGTPPGGNTNNGNIATFTMSQWQEEISKADPSKRKELIQKASRGEIKVLQQQ